MISPAGPRGKTTGKTIMETELILSVGGFPPLSARGCKQELIPVSKGALRRTINGELVLVGNQDLKYKSIIQCDDKTSLATNGLYPGAEVMVGWAATTNGPRKEPSAVNGSNQRIIVCTCDTPANPNARNGTAFATFPVWSRRG